MPDTVHVIPEPLSLHLARRCRYLHGQGYLSSAGKDAEGRRQYHLTEKGIKRARHQQALAAKRTAVWLAKRSRRGVH